MIRASGPSYWNSLENMNGSIKLHKCLSIKKHDRYMWEIFVFFSYSYTVNIGYCFLTLVFKLKRKKTGLGS